MVAVGQEERVVGAGGRLSIRDSAPGVACAAVSGASTSVGRSIDGSEILLCMKAYWLDLRQRIVAAIAGGMKQADVAAPFRVSISTIQRFVARRRRDETDDLTATTPAGRHRSITPAHHAA